MSADGGYLSGISNGNSLNLGQSYSTTAYSYSGYLFTGWTGSFLSLDPTLTFTMARDVSLQANFLAYSDLAGKFLGLLSETPAPHGASGLLSLKVDPTGGFTGSVRLQGKTFPVQGYFSDDGTAVLFSNSLTISLRATQLYGDLEIVGSASIGGSAIPLSAKRSSYSLGQPSELAGSFLVSLPAADASDATVPGDTSLKMRVSLNGLIQLTGQLSDGTRIAATTRLLDDSTFSCISRSTAARACSPG